MEQIIEFRENKIRWKPSAFNQYKKLSEPDGSGSVNMATLNEWAAKLEKEVCLHLMMMMVSLV